MRSRLLHRNRLACPNESSPFRLSLALVFAVVASCEAFDSSKTVPESNPSAAMPAPSPLPTADTHNDGSLAWPPAVLAAIHRGVSLPGAGNGTYLVDSFVAAMVYDELTSNGHRYATRVDAAGPRPAGYELRDIEAHPLLSRLGLRDSDIVVELDGQSLADVDTPGRLVATAARQITLKVFRHDHAFVLVYRLQPAMAWHGIVGSPSQSDVPSTNAPGDESSETNESPGSTPIPHGPTATPSTDPPSDSPPDRPLLPSKPKSKSKPQTKPKSEVEPPDPSTNDNAASNSDVHCSSPGHCTITRAAFSRLTASPERTRREYGIVPAVRNDVHSGYKIKKVPPGSHLAAMGFRPDDKVTHINGIFVADDAQAIRLMSMVSSSRTFQVRYERRGIARVKTIVVR